MRAKRPICDIVTPNRVQVARELRRRRARLNLECAAIESQFFAGKPALLAGGRFVICGRHYT